jgi:hypothetical protein
MASKSFRLNAAARAAYLLRGVTAGFQVIAKSFGLLQQDWKRLRRRGRWRARRCS